MAIIGIKSYGDKRFLTQNIYLRSKFGKKTIKLSLNTGCSCPNRDGSKGFGGCTYCSSSLSGDFSAPSKYSITDQLKQQTELLSSKWKDCLYIAYFQAGSNTYGSFEKLKAGFEEALRYKDVVGIAIATRADCISPQMLDYLGELSHRTYLTVELGLQTVHDKTADRINRCHSYDDFLREFELLTSRNINVCVHIINGLPYETHDMMMRTATEVSRLHPHSVKIHMLHILRNTVLETQYNCERFHILSLDEYIDITADQIELMPPDTVIARITGDPDRNSLTAPAWTANKKAVLNGIDKELTRRQSWQGKYFNK
ncbi:MAG: TIGR01212 family radical SAM protein [Oscillospiraceae bacterium]|nr:TIGR01212 family radical SAM protein [Oscillospiraceae bacterium]